MHRIIVALIAVLLTLPVLAEKPREVKLNASKMDFDQEKQLVRLIGNVRIVSEGVVMTSPYAEYHLDTQIGDFVGGVKIVGQGSTATGKKMRVFYADQKARLKGKVRVVSERAPGSDKTTPTVMLSDELEYLWEKNEGIAKGHVKVRQGDQRGFADRAHYFKERDIVIMEGNVRFEKGGEDWLNSSRATMNLKDDTVVAEGGVVARTRLQPRESARTEPTGKGKKPLPPSILLEPKLPLVPVERIEPLPLPGLE